MDTHFLPSPFNTGDFNLHHHHHHQRPRSEDEHCTGPATINPSLKRDRDDINNNDDDEGNDQNLNNMMVSGASDVGGEMTRRSRGRPAGSKNNQKLPIIINRDSANTLRTHVMEMADGCDILESVSGFARRRKRGLCIMSGTGTVTNVTLKQPASTSEIVRLNGIFEILSLAGSFLPPPAPAAATGLSIYLGGGQGQVVGGSVVGTLIASGTVVIMAASFSNASYERLPLDEDEVTMHGTSNNIGSPTDQIQQQQQVLAEPNSSEPLFHGLTPNLLNSIQIPTSDQIPNYNWVNGRPLF